MSQEQITTNASAATAQKLTRRMKLDAMNVFRSRAINDRVAYRLIGWLENDVHDELWGDGSKTVAKAMAEFVIAHMGEIRELPLRKTED